MNKLEVLEFNKRCAEFLNLKLGWWIHQDKPLTDDKKQWWDIDGKTILGTRVYYNNDLQFHSDWNWIHEVLKHIEELKWNEKFAKSIYVSINFNECSIYDFDYKFTAQGLFFTHKDSTTKEAVIQTINQFLIWYKQNIK